ncbi:MAG: hypothetical protein GF417_00835 [Candidatus Latescibacteria bacterium]|nr:hypothetical protein [bacterium]MBD3422971.1 hypothetical protein [Candidatus Latescibacterota bacterium]
MNTDYLNEYSVLEMARKLRIELIQQANEKRFKYEQASNRKFESDRVLKELSDAADISAIFCIYSERILEYLSGQSN